MSTAWSSGWMVEGIDFWSLRQNCSLKIWVCDRSRFE
jgi:hypothetical protein